MRLRWLFAGSLLLFLVACQGGSTADVGAQTANVAITGVPLVSYGQPDGSVGAVPPTLTGVSFDGEPVTVDPADGAQLLLFVAHWCPHCQNEVPVVVDWLEGGGLPDNVKLTIVSTAVEPGQPNYPPSEWLARENVTVPILVDDVSRNAASAYGLTFFPYWVAIDASGRVAGRLTGEIPVATLDTIVAELAGS